jgi:hypothetical protein
VRHRYSNIASDGAGNVHAWTILTDNYTNIGSGCAPPLWVTYGFHHTYSTSVTITSPSHRTVTTTGSGSQLGGSATGTVRTDASLPMSSEHGTFTESGFDSITCSIAGAFFLGPFSIDFTPPPPQITGVRDNSTGSTTINVGTSGYLSIYGFALTAWGESLPPVISADDQSLTFYAANDNQVNVSYTVANNARVGQHSVWVTTEAGTSNTGTYMVYDATPVITSISPSTWQAGTTTAVTITGRGFGTNPAVTFSDSYAVFTRGAVSDASIAGTVTINGTDPSGNYTLTVTSTGYGSGWQGAGGQSQSANQVVSVSPLTVTQSPSAFNVSTGDTPSSGSAKYVTSTVTPVTTVFTRSFSSTRTTNPSSSCPATLTVTDTSGTGSVQSLVAASPAGCSGVFSLSANVAGKSASSSTEVIVPPQALIQQLHAEAHGYTDNPALDPLQLAQRSVGMTDINRFGYSSQPLIFGGVSTFQDLVAQVPKQVASDATPNGPAVLIDNAALVFARRISDPTGGSSCYWSPLDTQTTIITNALAAPSTTFPTGLGDPQCFCYPNCSTSQVVVKSGMPKNTVSNKTNSPAFVFERSRVSIQPAVVQIP